MGRAFDFEYLDAAGNKCGEMVCASCSQKITTGEFRAYKRHRRGDWVFVTHHRACCADAPGWVIHDAARAKHEKTVGDLLEAAKEFRRRWDIDDLDDLIECLEKRR